MDHARFAEIRRGHDIQQAALPLGGYGRHAGNFHHAAIGPQQLHAPAALGDDRLAAWEKVEAPGMFEPAIEHFGAHRNPVRHDRLGPRQSGRQKAGQQGEAKAQGGGFHAGSCSSVPSCSLPVEIDDKVAGRPFRNLGMKWAK